MVDRRVSATEGGSVATDLLNRIRRLIEELKDARRTKDADDCRVSNLRNTAKELTDQLLDSDLEFATVKDVEGLFWKEVVYRTFESLQRVYTQSLDKRQAGELLRLYLNESSGFYWRLRDRLLQQESWAFPGAPTPEWVKTAAFKCYIRLGDLERYHTLHSESSAKNFSSAVRCYELARRFLPFNGNAHNQLAVVATYRGDTVSALYHYYRAILNGFPIAKRNAELLLKTQGDDASVQTGKAPSSWKATCVGFTGEFLRLHRLLFTTDNLRKVPSLMESVVRKYTELLKNGSLDHVECCRVTLINISEYHIAKLADSKSTAFARLLLLKMFFALAVECDKLLKTVKMPITLNRRLPLKARALLPSIRLHVKHFIQNREVYRPSRSAESDTEATIGWRSYASLVDRVRSAYPRDIVAHDWLEEDVECFGFAPVGRCGSGWRDNPVVGLEQWEIRCRDMVADQCELGDPLVDNEGIDSQPPYLGAGPGIPMETVQIRQIVPPQSRSRSSSAARTSTAQRIATEESDDEEVILLSLPSRRQAASRNGPVDASSVLGGSMFSDTTASPSVEQYLGNGGNSVGDSLPVERSAEPQDEESDGNVELDYVMEKMVYDIAEDPSDSAAFMSATNRVRGMEVNEADDLEYWSAIPKGLLDDSPARSRYEVAADSAEEIMRTFFTNPY